MHKPTPLTDNGADRDEHHRMVEIGETNECCVCGGTLVYIGPLANTHWFRCRDCGIEQSRQFETGEE